MHELIFDDPAITFLEGLPKELRKRIYQKIISAKENPHHFFKRLADRKDYKLRIGDYRVIADIEENHKRIKVTLIGHRKNIYQKQ